MRQFTLLTTASLLATEAFAFPSLNRGLTDDRFPPWAKGYIHPSHDQTSGSPFGGKKNSTGPSTASPTSTGSPAISAASTDSTVHQSGGGKYIVLFKNGASASTGGVEISAQDTVSTASTDDVLSQLGLTADHPDVHATFDRSNFRGFTASMKSHCLDQLANMSDIAVVEKSMKVTTHAAARNGGPWGLERISTASTVSGNPSSLDFTYTYANTALGSGVDIYVVDTGINTQHVAFGGRATMQWSYSATNEADGDGHGTHVSGTAAGTTFGVASAANLIGVKVLDDSGSGQSSDTVNGIQWVIGQHNAKKNQPGFVGSVLSMSWGLTEKSAAIDAVIRSATEAGIHAAVAAGNQGSDSCSTSPSSSGGSAGPAVAVGSVGISNAISSFSNTGACNDLYAPGENIISAWIGGDNVINQLQGTSMATPHVTGVMAYLMVAKPELAQDPAAMKSYLTSTALQNTVSGTANTGDPRLLLNNGVTGAVVKRAADVPIVKKGFPAVGGLNGALSAIRRWFDRRQTFYMAEGVSMLRY